MKDNAHSRGVRQYSADTLFMILRDLIKNPLSKERGTPEHGRRAAITAEIQRRGKLYQ